MKRQMASLRLALVTAAIRGDKSAAGAPQIQPPLFFNLGMRIGGHPCHYMPEGRQRLTNLERDVAVIGRHEDGTPLLTCRRVGKGAAICFNVLRTGESGLAQSITEATETFRQVIDQLTRRCGVTPDFEFENTRAYGEGISDFITMQYELPGTQTRIAGRKGAEVLAVSGKPYLRVLKVGKGMLVLDRRSPDASGNSNLHRAAYQQAWRQKIEACGPAPNGAGATLLPVGGETLRQWFFAE